MNRGATFFPLYYVGVTALPCPVSNIVVRHWWLRGLYNLQWLNTVINIFWFWKTSRVDNKLIKCVDSSRNFESTHIQQWLFFHCDPKLNIQKCSSVASGSYREWYMYSRGELFMRSREGYFGVYFPSCVATMEINTKLSLAWAHKQFVTRVTYIILFLTRHNESINNAKTRIFTHYPRVSLAPFTLCWWRHNGLAMRYNDQAIVTRTRTCDIYLVGYRFIHGDIHGRSYKKYIYRPIYVDVYDQNAY